MDPVPKPGVVTTALLTSTIVLALGGCAPRPAASEVAANHYYDLLGNTLEQLEPAYARLQAFYGTSMPARITVRYTDRDHSLFHANTSSVSIAIEHLARPARQPEATIAHETSHLALHALTHGASSLERFRFIDEGLAYMLAARVTDEGETFRAKALAKAAAAHQERTIDFARVQAWDSYGSRRAHAENPNAYAVGASFVFFLLDERDEKQLHEFLVALGRTTDLDAALRETYGMSGQEAEARWQRYLGRIKVDPSALESPPMLARTIPKQDEQRVSPTLRELVAEFDRPMDTNRMCIQTRCDDGVCYKNARWESPTRLVVAVTPALLPAHRYELSLGGEDCRLRSASLVELRRPPGPS
jgi:hypothetical protein